MAWPMPTLMHFPFTCTMALLEQISWWQLDGRFQDSSLGSFHESGWRQGGGLCSAVSGERVLMEAFILDALYCTHKRTHIHFHATHLQGSWHGPCLRLCFSPFPCNFFSFFFMDKETMPSFQAKTIPESCGVFLVMIIGSVVICFWVAIDMNAVTRRVCVGGKVFYRAWSGAAKPWPNSLFVEGWGCPAASHVLQIFLLLPAGMWVFANLHPSFQQYTFVCKCGHINVPIYFACLSTHLPWKVFPTFLCSSSWIWERGYCWWVFFALAATTIILSLALVFSSSFFLVGGFIFISWCWLNDDFFVEIGGEGDVETRQKDSHVEVVKVIEAFFDFSRSLHLQHSLRKRLTCSLTHHWSLWWQFRRWLWGQGDQSIHNWRLQLQGWGLRFYQQLVVGLSLHHLFLLGCRCLVLGAAGAASWSLFLLVDGPPALATRVGHQDASKFFEIFVIPDFFRQRDFNLLGWCCNICINCPGAMADEASHYQSCVVVGAPKCFAAVDELDPPSCLQE